MMTEHEASSTSAGVTEEQIASAREAARDALPYEALITLEQGGLDRVVHAVLEASRVDAPVSQKEVVPVRYLYDFVDPVTGAVIEEVSKVDRSGEPRVSILSALHPTPTPVSAPVGETLARWKIPASELSDDDLVAEYNDAADKFDNRGEHGGSPGEFWYERMDEITAEQKRRTLRSPAVEGK